MTFPDSIRRALENGSMASPGDLILVALSGGADSTALLHALYEQRDELGIELAAAHLNHTLRGTESDADAAWCAALAGSLEIEFRCEKIDVGAIAEESGANLEEKARECRYAFLERAADELGAARIAIAHTADDQVETVLLRLLRGAGRSGLGGMRPLRGRIIRPMLGTKRADVLAYLESRKLPYREDSSNRDERFSRVFLRKRVMPLLRQLNPSLERTIGKAASLIADEDDFLRELAEGVLREISSKDSSGVRLEAAALESLHPALQRLVLRRLLLGELGSLRGIEAGTIEAMRRLAQGRGPAVDLGPLVFARHEKNLLIHEKAGGEPDSIPLYSYSLSPGQTLRVKEVDKSFSLRNIDAPDGLDIEGLSGPRRAFLDADAAGEVLEVRNWLPGDRYRPLGAPGSQKLQDLFVNAKIPRYARRSAPVFLSRGRICWVSGLRVGEEFRVKPGSSRLLIIEEVDDGKAEQ